MNIAKIIEMSQSVEIAETESVDGYTPYAVWTVIVETMRAMDLDSSKVTSQSIYNAAKSGRIDGRKHESTRGVRFDEETVENFVARFVAKQTKIQN